MFDHGVSDFIPDSLIGRLYFFEKPEKDLQEYNYDIYGDEAY